MGGRVVEAERYDINSPIAPFVIQTAGGVDYIVAMAGDLTAPTEASNTAQAYYSLKATAAKMTIYATVNLPVVGSDSFHYRIAGLTNWVLQNEKQTMGFQEIQLASVTNAVVGQTYVFKVQRREAGALLDKFRISGGLFLAGTDVGVPVELNPEDLTAGKANYNRLCVDCHGPMGAVGGENGGPILTAANRANLVKLINDTMPKADPSQCKDQCAVDVAGYILNGYSNVRVGGCANSNWIFCEDFEKYTTATMPNGVWQDGGANYGNNWSALTSELKSKTGKKSAQFHLGGGQEDGRAYIKTSAPFPLKTYYGRMFMYTSVVPNNAHFIFIDSSGAGGNSFVWGGQFGNIAANYFPGDCAKNYRNLQPKANVWQCVEWKFDGVANEMQIWFDDLAQTNINHAVITNGQGSDFGACSWKAPDMFGNLTIGWGHYHQAINQDVWIDDLVVDSKRIGCGQ